MRKITPSYSLYSTGTQLWILGALFFILFLAVSLLGGILQAYNDVLGERNVILTISCLQTILAFILPSYIVARMINATPTKILGLSIPSNIRNILGIIIMFGVAMPALNLIIEWNDSIHLPEQMKNVETSLREMEDASRNIAEILLDSTSVWGLISGVLVVGCLTGVGEEMFFRGGLQRILGEKLSHHAAIWLAAAIFSLMHFQFFGFIPRVLLGAAFGYLYVWSGSLWTAAIAHALNNSLVVLESWLRAAGYINFTLENIGIPNSGFPLIPAISAVLTLLFFLLFRKFFFFQKKRSFQKYN